MKRLLFFPMLVVLIFSLRNIEQPTTIVAKATNENVRVPIKTVAMQESAVAMGVQFEHARRSYRQNSITDMYGNGACVLDFDGDGFEDIIMVAGQGTTRRYGRDNWWNTEQNSLLYRNHQGKYFEPITLVEDIAIAGFGCTVGDLNHDGRDDVVIGDIGKLHLLINKGNRFNHYTRQLNKRDWPTSLMITDINQDQLNDIVVATLVDYRNDVKVGDQEYGYQSQPTIKTSDYAGQSNLVLQALTKDQLAYAKIELVGQQRTLNWLKLNEQQLLAVNAKGSNSVVQGLNHHANPYDWLTFAAVQISPINLAGEPHLLIANHGLRGIQLLDFNSRLNKAWSIGLTNQTIDASQSWANVIGDFNNDGFDDVFVAAGFASTAMNSPSRAQASSNFLLLQDNLGQFHNSTNQIKPKLNRSSRGAVHTDVNNDGFIDLVVINNNNFASLYINQANDNHWLSIDCQPRQLCLDSLWTLQTENSRKTVSYNKVEPYLSHGSSRIHFGLADNSNILSLTANFNDAKQLVFNDVVSDQLYQVNLTTAEIKPVAKTAQPRAEQSFESLLMQLLLSETSDKTASKQPIEVLSQFDSNQVSELLSGLHRYKQGLGKNTSTKAPNITAAIGWILAQNPQVTTQLIDLLIASENRLFIDYMVAIIPELSSDNFCYLSEHLHYWFEEEEVLPETKLMLLAPLLQRGFKSPKQRDLICAIEAVSYAEQTTIGASLLPLLDSQKAIISATVVRAIGRLKYARGITKLKNFCQAIDNNALILAAECQISLHKLGAGPNKRQRIADKKQPNDSQRFMALHGQNLLFDTNHQVLDLARLSRYQHSALREHRFLAYQALLLQNHYQTLLTKPDIVDFVKKAKNHYPHAIDKLVTFAVVNNSHFKTQLLSGMSNQGLTAIFNGDIDQPLALALIKLCQSRQSLKPQCQRRFGQSDSKLNLTALSANHLINMPKEQLYYLLSFGTTIEKRVIARRLAEQQQFELLHLQQLYRLVGQIEPNWGLSWLEAFLRFSFEHQHHVDLAWLQQASRKETSGQWTRLYLAHLAKEEGKK